MSIVKLFKNYLTTRVLFLDDIILTWNAVRRKRKKKVFQQKKNKCDRIKREQKAHTNTIMGLSRTVIKPLINIIGESKTKIPDISDFILSEIIPDSVNEKNKSKSITTSLTDGEDIDIEAEEIPLEYNTPSSGDSSVATGISIEEIEQMNKLAENPEACSNNKYQTVQNTIEKLLGTNIIESQSKAFSTQLSKLLDECISKESEEGSTDTDSSIDKWFNQ